MLDQKNFAETAWMREEKKRAVADEWIRREDRCKTWRKRCRSSGRREEEEEREGSQRSRGEGITWANDTAPAPIASTEPP